MPANTLGPKGEAIAAKYYRQRGYLLLGRNYRTRMGELDLVLYKDGTVVFAEVKARTSPTAAPAAAVDRFKQRRLIRAAQSYLQNSPYTDCPARFDVLEVQPVPGRPGTWQVHCIANAFSLD